MKFRLIIISLVLMAVALATGFGCNSYPSNTEPGTSFNYYLTGAVIQDPNIDSSIVLAKLTRNGIDYGSADLTFDGDLLFFNFLKYNIDSIYTFNQSATPGYLTAQVNLIMDDSPFLIDTAFIRVADSFSIISGTLVPGNHLITGFGTASYEWTGSANIDGYIMAAVKADSAYKGQGFSQFLNLSVNAGTIPADAFTLPVSSEPDTGLYNLYVYAISGSPDSAMVSKLLPTPLPVQLTDNIAQGNLTGHFGSVGVTLIDTLRVVTSP